MKKTLSDAEKRKIISSARTNPDTSKLLKQWGITLVQLQELMQENEQANEQPAPPETSHGHRTTLLYIVYGSIILIAVCILFVFIVPHPTQAQYYAMLILLSLGGAAFSIAFPGALEVKLPNGIHATGVLAVFVFILLSAPQWSYPIKLMQVKGTIDIPGNGNLQKAMITFEVQPPLIQLYDKRFVIQILPVDPRISKPPVMGIMFPGYNTRYITLEDTHGEVGPAGYIIKLVHDSSYVYNTVDKLNTYEIIRPIVLEQEPLNTTPISGNPVNSYNGNSGFAAKPK